MVAVAIFSADTALGRSFEKLLRDEQSAAFLGAVDHTTALSKLAEKHGIDQYGKAGVKKEDQPFQSRRDVLQTDKIEKTAHIIA